MKLLKTSTSSALHLTTLCLKEYEVLITSNDGTRWVLCFHMFCFLPPSLPPSLCLTVCIHCCFSFSKTKLRCFLAALSTVSWCLGETRSSLGSVDLVWARPAETEESRRVDRGLMEHTANREEGEVSSRVTKSKKLLVKDQEGENTNNLVFCSFFLKLEQKVWDTADTKWNSCMN